jgi:hypothetical protein
MVTLNRHFDDLEADAADTGGFYAKDSSGEVRYIPESRKFEWLESEQDRIDDILSEFPDFNSATNFSNDYLIPGGQNYREILYKLPDDKVEGVFLPPASHYTDAMNTFGTIRSTDRTIDGTPTLFAEEIQSDWAIAGAKRGYAIDKKAELPEGTRIFAPGEADTGSKLVILHSPNTKFRSRQKFVLRHNKRRSHSQRTIVYCPTNP